MRPGIHDVWLSIADGTYPEHAVPTGVRRGVLEVSGSGVGVINLEAVPVTVKFTFRGSPLTPTESDIRLSFVGPNGYFTDDLEPSDNGIMTASLDPGLNVVTARTTNLPGLFPRVAMTREFRARVGHPLDIDFNLDPVLIEGTVSVDGELGGSLEFRTRGGSQSIPLAGDGPSNFHALVWGQDTHEVYYHRTAARPVLVDSTWEVGDSADFHIGIAPDVETVPITVSVEVNGLPDSIQLTDISPKLLFGAPISIWSDPGEVTVEGNKLIWQLEGGLGAEWDFALSAEILGADQTWRLASHVPLEEHIDLEISYAEVTVSGRVRLADGSVAPLSYPVIHLDDGRYATIRLNTGAEVVVPSGPAEIYFRHGFSTSYSDSRLNFPRFDIRGGEALQFDGRLFNLSGILFFNERRVNEAAKARIRWRGYPGGSTRSLYTGSYDVTLPHGIHGVSFYCTDEACAEWGLRTGRLDVYEAIELPAEWPE